MQMFGACPSNNNLPGDFLVIIEIVASIAIARVPTCADIVWPHTEAPPAVVKRVGKRSKWVRRAIQKQALNTINHYNQGKLDSSEEMSSYLAKRIPVNQKRQDQFRREMLAKFPNIMASSICNKRLHRVPQPLPVKVKSARIRTGKRTTRFNNAKSGKNKYQKRGFTLSNKRPNADLKKATQTITPM